MFSRNLLEVEKSHDGGDDLACSSKMQEFDLPTMDQNEQKLWKIFRERNGGIIMQWPLDERPSDITINTDITVTGIMHTKQDTESMATLPRTPPPSLGADKTNETETEFESTGQETVLNKKLSLYNFKSSKYDEDGRAKKIVAFQSSELSSAASSFADNTNIATIVDNFQQRDNTDEVKSG